MWAAGEAGGQDMSDSKHGVVGVSEMVAKAQKGEEGPFPFSVEEYERRLKRVREGLREISADFLLVTNSVDIFYLSNFQNSGQEAFQCLIVPVDGPPHFVLRRLYFTAVAGLSWIKDGTPVPDTGDHLDVLVACLRQMGADKARIGYQDRSLSLPPAILDGLRSALPEASPIPASGIVERCRAVKSPAEISYIRRAADLSVKGMEAGIAEIRPNADENQVAAAVYDTMVRAGSDYVSAQPIVVSGSRNPPYRCVTEGRVIQDGESVWFEASASVHRYGGPIMRTISVGEPSADLKKASDVMLAALDRLLDVAGPGVTAGEVDRAARSFVEERGYGQYWLHRSGYSVGVGFPPSWTEGEVMDLKPGDPRPLLPGMVFHSVPWILLPGIGAVGNSETWAVTNDGIEVLTDTPRELRICR